MEELIGLGPSDPIYKRILARYDVPAYVRRARAVQDAWELLLSACRRQREMWLTMPRMRLGMVSSVDITSTRRTELLTSSVWLETLASTGTR